MVAPSALAKRSGIPFGSCHIVALNLRRRSDCNGRFKSSSLSFQVMRTLRRQSLLRFAARAGRLREARKRHFKTVKAAAKFHKWSIATLSSHELGGRAFKYEGAEKYAKTFGVDIDWLWNGSEGSSKRPLAPTSSATPASQHSSGRGGDLRWPENSESSLKSEMEALGLCLVHAKELLDLVQRALKEYQACRHSTPGLPKSPQEAESRKDCV
jgi:hypothetical protein